MSSQDCVPLGPNLLAVTVPLLEVIALGPGDALGAQEGGADRLYVAAEVAEGGLTPELRTVREIRRETSLPIRVVLRANPGFSTSGSEMSRLRGTAQELAVIGVDGFALGFLTPTNDVDLDACLVLLQSTEGLDVSSGDGPCARPRPRLARGEVVAGRGYRADRRVRPRSRRWSRRANHPGRPRFRHRSARHGR